MPDWNPQANKVFLDALEIAEAEERGAFIENACAGDADLEDQVVSLIAASQKAGRFLETPPLEVRFNANRTVDSPPGEQVVRQIGPYRLLEQIGEGGMGTVFLAEQSVPVHRKVALKVIKAGMDTRSAIARFEAERQALTLMDHVNIARVLDGGTTESGQPYFVMELIDGVPITTYCDENLLAPRERLALFVPVCQAIQHAHQKGIIHRDIKPSNVLVTLYDGHPVPKVIDFGVAKAIEQKLTERTLFTQHGTMVGTLEYMSPEQAEMSDLGIDTRSDIYSLGVLLYELLTGNTPLSHKRVREGAYAEIIRMIQNEEPPRPSARLSDSGEELASISALRHMEPARLAKLVRGELDWIVMKTLEKDRNRRYESASGFAMDLQRYLADEPVLACPPSAMYRIGKFTRRNKAALGMALVIGVALLLAVGSLGWVVRDREASRTRTALEVNQFLQRAESLYAVSKLSEAAGEVEKARGVLEASGGDEELGRSVQQWLTDLNTAAQFEALRRQHPDITDWEQVNAEYAQVFREYGIDTETLSVEAAATQIAHSRIMFELTVALDTWAWRLQIAPRKVEPARWMRLRAIQRAADPDPWRQRLHRATDVGDLKALCEMADEVDMERVHIRTLALLGSHLTDRGDPETGVALLRKAQRQHPGSFLINDVLARCLTRLKPPPWHEVIEFRRVALALNPTSASAHAALGEALNQENRRDEAFAEYSEAIRLEPNNHHSRDQRGWMLFALDKFAEAEVEFMEAIRLNPDHDSSHFGLGLALQEQKKNAEALAPLRESIRLNPKSHYAHDALGWALVNTRGFVEAENAFREVIRLNPDLLQGHFGLGRALVEQEKHSDAEAALRKALRLDPAHRWSRQLLGRALIGQGKTAEAEAIKEEESDPNLRGSEKKKQPE